ncbi:pilus assembly protein [Pseudomonas sp. CGJS7]|uniref:pilus assembly protein n=1 Tax=Pseudomonas sp. CGJS7 TaxID=3109348 RepID=UPI003009B56F
MASARTLITASSLLLVAAGGAYWYYNANALQADGDLAQAPLNSSVTVAPAFIMAVDDSGSMTFQTLFKGSDGGAFWNIAEDARTNASGTVVGNGFFTGTGADARMRTQNDANDADEFYYVMPTRNANLENSFGNNGYGAIPPFDKYGFARSSEFNPAYFNPSVTYLRWKRPKENGTEIEDYPDSSKTAASADPSSDTAPTYDLTNSLFAYDPTRNFKEYFRVPKGMYLPAGTEYFMYKYVNWDYDRRGNRIWLTDCGGLTGQETVPGTLRKVGASGHQMSASCYVAIKYFPAVYYMKSATAGAASGYTGTPDKIENACGDGCALYKYEIKPGNYNTVNYEKAIVNFANWFSYYGNRNRAMKAALTLSMDTVSRMRIGMFAINAGGKSVTDGNNNVIEYNYNAVTMRDMDKDTDKRDFYNNELLKLGASGGTPNRWAVRHVGRQFMRKKDDPGAPIKSACQINAGMLFTDGYSNTSGPPLDKDLLGDAKFPDPLKDTFSNTMADHAAAYYQVNLRDDMEAGKVPVPDACKTTPNDPKLDCNKNLHMNFYGVTLGAKGKIYGNTYDPIKNSPDPYVTFPAWETRQDSNPTTVDEIWHATMNGRGKFINATTPADITSAMREIIASLGGGETPSGSIGLVGARVGSNTLSVTPTYESGNSGTDWFSRLFGSKATYNNITGKIEFVQLWEASSLLADAGRNISYGVLTADSVKVETKQFQASTMGTDEQILKALCNDPLQNCAGKFNRITDGTTPGVSGTDAIAYLRGSRAHDGGKLRKRTTLLGDIVNSTPLVTSKGDDYGYMALKDSRGVVDGREYGKYLKQKFTYNKPYVYVGANDGMFHAFDGTSGRESFAYIPSTSLGHMGNLLFPYNPADRNDQVFKHRYYVDGPITAADAYSAGAWKSVLVASVGAGGRGVFGLDVTNQGTLKVLWELTDKSGAANKADDLGSVLGKPAIVPVQDASGTVTWKAIFGNGYGSKNGKAVLFVVDVMTGAVTAITAEETGANKPTRTKNGLGNIIVIDSFTGTTDDPRRDGYADTVYAGDLNGALWKFDLRSNKVAFDGKPLFVARHNDDFAKRQPIVGGLEATSVNNRAMIFFGTGSFSFDGDPTSTEIQTMYGVMDPNEPVAGRSKLQRQFIVKEENGERILTGNKRLALGVLGWYLDLGVDVGSAGNPKATGERMVGNPRIQNGIVFFPTFDPTSTDACATDGNNWLYGLAAVDGGSALYNARIGSPTGAQGKAGTGAAKLKSDNGKPMTAPVKDVVVLAGDKVNYVEGGAGPTAIEDAKKSKCSVMIQTSGSQPYYLPRPCGRQSWRQIR